VLLISFIYSSCELFLSVYNFLPCVMSSDYSPLKISSFVYIKTQVHTIENTSSIICIDNAYSYICILKKIEIHRF